MLIEILCVHRLPRRPGRLVLHGQRDGWRGVSAQEVQEAESHHAGHEE